MTKLDEFKEDLTKLTEQYWGKRFNIVYGEYPPPAEGWISLKINISPLK